MAMPLLINFPGNCIKGLKKTTESAGRKTGVPPLAPPPPPALSPCLRIRDIGRYTATSVQMKTKQPIIDFLLFPPSYPRFLPLLYSPRSGSSSETTHRRDENGNVSWARFEPVTAIYVSLEQTSHQSNRTTFMLPDLNVLDSKFDPHTGYCDCSLQENAAIVT